MICTKCKCDPQDYPFPGAITFNDEGVCTLCTDREKMFEKIKEKIKEKNNEKILVGSL